MTLQAKQLSGQLLLAYFRNVIVWASFVFTGWRKAACFLQSSSCMCCCGCAAYYKPADCLRTRSLFQRSWISASLACDKSLSVSSFANKEDDKRLGTIPPLSYSSHARIFPLYFPTANEFSYVRTRDNRCCTLYSNITIMNKCRFRKKNNNISYLNITFTHSFSKWICSRVYNSVN